MSRFKNLTKEEKIKILNQLESGELNIEDLSPNTCVISTFLDYMKASTSGKLEIADKVVVKGEMKSLFENLVIREAV